MRQSQNVLSSQHMDDPEKQEAIETLLVKSVTTSLTLRPRVGELIYFEHEFSNNCNVPVSVGIYWNGENLR